MDAVAADHAGQYTQALSLYEEAIQLLDQEELYRELEHDEDRLRVADLSSTYTSRLEQIRATISPTLTSNQLVHDWSFTEFTVETLFQRRQQACSDVPMRSFH